MAEEAGKKGFKVEDRRRFTPETGEPREPSETAAETDADAKSKEEPQQEESSGQGPEISFSTFIISLSTQALMHLGEIPNPLSGTVEKDVSVAKQMIDMLREKTQGNLDQGENKLVEDVLFDLRMRYVEAVKKK